MDREELEKHIEELVDSAYYAGSDAGDEAGENGDGDWETAQILRYIDQYVDWVIGDDSHAEGRSLAGATIRDVINNVKAQQRTRARINQQNNK